MITDPAGSPPLRPVAIKLNYLERMSIHRPSCALNGCFGYIPLLLIALMVSVQPVSAAKLLGGVSETVEIPEGLRPGDRFALRGRKTVQWWRVPSWLSGIYQTTKLKDEYGEKRRCEKFDVFGYQQDARGDWWQPMITPNTSLFTDSDGLHYQITQRMRLISVDEKSFVSEAFYFDALVTGNGIVSKARPFHCIRTIKPKGSRNELRAQEFVTSYNERGRKVHQGLIVFAPMLVRPPEPRYELYGVDLRRSLAQFLRDNGHAGLAPR